MSNNTKPTQPGRWWADLSGWWQMETQPDVVTVYMEDGRPVFDGMNDDQEDSEQVQWLAPVPSPAVCEALARYAEALTRGDDDTFGPLAELRAAILAEAEVPA